MHITRLRLLGFKSFVEPAELIVSPGLTGVVGPNGCGKSNLLEALRWVMGESSHKSMRAAAMEDVIFNGTTQRPARNSAEVTVFIDNGDRKAPAEFNGEDTLEVTRRIERDAGSAFRLNGKEVRARDVRILFEDAATGARSPALVRQGQIGELVNAKPEQRRRILEDAAGIAGLHSRRHEAELRLRAAEGNLARLGDILEQLTAQIEGLKRQARQARRYREVSVEIRRLEALVAHLRWTAAQAAVAAEEQGLAAQLGTLGEATEAEAKALRAEADSAAGLQPLRQEEAAKGALLARLRNEDEAVAREAERIAERQKELAERQEQLTRDLAREQSLIAEAKETLQRYEAERTSLASTAQLAAEFEQKALRACEDAEGTLRLAEDRLGELTTAAAEARARRARLEEQRQERQQQIDKLQRQLVALETQTREIVGRAPDASKLKSLAERGQLLMERIADIEAKTLVLEEVLREGAADAAAKSERAAAAALAAGQIKTEVETLAKVLAPAGGDELPPILDAVTVEPGYELALAAALGDDLEAPENAQAPVHWRSAGRGKGDPALPSGALPLSGHVTAPAVLARRLAQIGVVPAAEGALLQPLLKSGQRLVSVEGHLWRWDGLVVTAQASAAAANRLAERSRLGALALEEARLRSAAVEARSAAEEAAARCKSAEAEERRLRQLWRDAQAELAGTRDSLTAMERSARETEVRIAAVFDAKARAQDALAETRTLLAETEEAQRALPGVAALEGDLATAQVKTGELRRTVSERRTELIALEREHRGRAEREAAIAVECERWKTRSGGAEQQIGALTARLSHADGELTKLASLPAELAGKRQKLRDMLHDAEAERRAAADRLAAAETDQRQAAQEVRAAQAAVADAREARARIEAQLASARAHEREEVRRIRDTLGCAADQCLALAQQEAHSSLPPLAEADQQLVRLQADRERLGGVNLQAEDDLERLSTQRDGMDAEKRDVEAAIAKLRSAIAQINGEGRGRLQGAFNSVDGHFRSLFATLFGGGEARLEMIDAEDPLEGGLEIIAKPPGKKPATLSLLSGGEQSLTALALIFAVFLTNPSPICVLDEVDAPLDDANVDRFCTLMEKMASDTATRFLVITHHPMTMSRMNRLFGVTMGEKGVSQLVSVDLETAQKFTVAA
jgi:chromosome segregation protein